MRDKIIERLGAIYLERDNFVLDSYILDYTTIACSETNLKPNDKRLEPHIMSAVIKAYIRRGNEGISSSNESGFGVAYEDIEEKLRKNVKSLRVIR